MIATLDPGSKFSGLAAGVASPAGVLLSLATTIPTRRTPSTADYLETERADIAATADAIIRAFAPHAPSRLISELARDPYFPPGLSPQAYAAIVRAFRRMERLVEAVESRFLSIPAPVSRVTRNAWAHALLPGHQGGITNPAAHAAARASIDPASPAAPDTEHALDAIGILLAALRVVPAPRAAAPPPTPLTPAALLAARRASNRLSMTRLRATRAAPILALCACGPRDPADPSGPRLPRPPTRHGRHDFGCPAAGLASQVARRATV
jgi:hypothetical protein